MALDIGQYVFAELLGMTQYPGAPFTGDIVRDLILFLFVPSVFIILFVYMLLGRLFSVAAGAQTKLRLLLGVALYLFIVASGYYSFFALLAGPYFIFLIFILGAIYFIPHHFGFRQEVPGGHYPAGKRHGRGATFVQRINYLRAELKKYENQLIEAENKGSRDRALYLQQRIDEIREEIEDEEETYQPWRKKRAA